jgi:hypothetical protein
LSEFNLTADPVRISVFKDDGEVRGFDEVWVPKVLCFRQSPRIVDCNVPSASTLTQLPTTTAPVSGYNGSKTTVTEEMQGL